MAAEFQPGDVVRLNSGGPSMTVETLIDDNGMVTVHCSWFQESTLHEKAFNEKLLSKYRPVVGYAASRRS